MAVKFTRKNITSGYNTSLINENFENIETALDDALSRSGTLPNHMTNDLDMNSNDILNAGSVEIDALTINGDTISAQDIINAGNAAGLISDAVSQGNVPLYSTFDGLTDVTLPEGITNLRVAGRSTVGDSGDGLVTVHDSDPGTPTGLIGRSGPGGLGKYLRYVNQKELSVALFGLNVANRNLDQAVKMQSAIDSGLNLVIPAGCFIGVGSELNMVKNGQGIRGEGTLSTNMAVSYAPSSGFKHLGGTHNVLNIAPSSGFWTGNMLRDLVFDNELASDGHAVYMSSIQRSDFQNLYVHKPVKGIFTTDLNTPTFFNCRIVGASGQYSWRIQGRYGEGKSTDALRMLFCSGGGTAAGPDATPEQIAAANNETIGLWLDGSVAGGTIQYYTGQSVRNSIYMSVDTSDAGHYPAGLTLFRCGGDFLAGPTHYFATCADIKLFHPYSSNNLGYTSQSHGGDGIVLLEGARNVDIFGGEIKSAQDNGMYIAGENININDMNIYRNNVRSGGTSDNVYIASTSKRVRFSGNAIGHNLYSSSTSITDGRSIYGININSGVGNGEVVIFGNNDLRGNKTAAVNNPWAALMPDGIPLGVDRPGADRCDNGDFRVNQLAIADGSITGNTRIRDRWFSGSSGLTLATNADGSITINSGSSINQTDTENVVAGKRVWMAALVKLGSGTSSTFNVTLSIGASLSRTITIVKQADNGYQWVTYSGVVPSVETGNIVWKVASGANAITIAKVRHGFGGVCDIYSADKSPSEQLVACRRYLQNIVAGAASASFGSGRASSTSACRVDFKYMSEMATVPTASFGGSFAITYGSAGNQSVTLAETVGTTGKNGMLISATASSGTPFTLGDSVSLRSNNDSAAYIRLETGL